MRDDRVRVSDILRCTDAVLRYIGDPGNPADASDQKTLDAIFFNIIVIGEAANALLASGRRSDMTRNHNADIVAQNPDIPWQSWVGMRNLVTHQYFRRDPKVVLRDFQSGAFHQLAAACQKRLEDNDVAPPSP